MKSKLLIPFLFLLLVAACKKEEIDLKKYDNYKPEPEFGLPLVNADLTLMNMVKGDSTVVYDPDGFMRLFFRKSKIKEVTAPELLVIPPQPASTFEQKLGVVNINDIVAFGGRSLIQLRNGFQSQTTKDAVDQALANSPTNVPSLSDGVPSITQFTLFDGFEQAKISSGYIVVKFENKLSITVSSMDINLYDIAFLPATLIGTLTYTNIPPGGISVDSIDLAGKTLSNELGYNFVNITTAATTSPVAFLANDSVKFFAQTSHVVAYGGRSKFSDQNLQGKDLLIDITPDDPSTLIRKVEFNTASINYNYTSSVNQDIELSLNFVGATRNGVALPAQNLYITANSNVSGSINLDNTILDFTQDNAIPYNRLRILVAARLVATGTTVNFDSSNAVNISLNMSNLDFRYVEGFFGTRVITLDKGEVNLADLKKLNGTLIFENPKMSFITNNSMGIPMKAALNVDGENAVGATLPFNGPGFDIAYPTIAEAGQTKTGAGVYDVNNSNIRNVLGMPPVKFNYEGAVTTNVGLPNSTTNFLRSDSKISFDIETELPMSISSVGFGLMDSVNNGIKPGDLDNVVKAELVLRITNGFPFGGSVKLVFADSLGQRLDSVNLQNSLLPAPIDATGKVVKASDQTVSRIDLSGALLEHVKKATKIYIQPFFITSENGTRYVKIYSDYNINVKVGMNVKVKF
ncbi:MAG: hypothetical protein V4620_10760 [Bacteroidota bacterium]